MLATRAKQPSDQCCPACSSPKTATHIAHLNVQVLETNPCIRISWELVRERSRGRSHWHRWSKKWRAFCSPARRRATSRHRRRQSARRRLAATGRAHKTKTAEPAFANSALSFLVARGRFDRCTTRFRSRFACDCQRNGRARGRCEGEHAGSWVRLGMKQDLCEANGPAGAILATKHAAEASRSDGPRH